jgi:hypothetical protein
MRDLFVGVDIQTARPCPYAILDEKGIAIDADWLDGKSPEHTVSGLRTVLSRLGRERAVVGIDAPRCPLPSPRQWYWHGKKWVRRGIKEAGSGRHCEVVVAAHRLANPQWTPCRGPFQDWMQLGFDLFQELGTEFTVHEVFPTTSYTMLKDDPSVQISLRLGDLPPHPKDMLDAYVAAATVREFVQGRGCEVGGGDGLGTIILPRPLQNPITDVIGWPNRSKD